jgi:hypothetical protein
MFRPPPRVYPDEAGRQARETERRTALRGMEPADHVQHTAAGMIASFGKEAEHEARKIAKRWENRGQGAAEALWISVAVRIRQMTRGY